MRKLFSRAVVARAAAMAGVASLLAVPAWAGTIYSWRTGDGVYAFTDDPDTIPAAYRDAAVAREAGGLGGYARFSPKDPTSTARYEERLAARLERLRALNARSERAPVTGAPRVRPVISVRTGGINAPSLELRPSEEEGPIIVERLRYRPRGQIATRHNLVVRQGKKTLAVVKGRLEGEIGASLRIRDEAELER